MISCEEVNFTPYICLAFLLNEWLINDAFQYGGYIAPNGGMLETIEIKVKESGLGDVSNGVSPSGLCDICDEIIQSGLGDLRNETIHTLIYFSSATAVAAVAVVELQMNTEITLVMIMVVIITLPLPMFKILKCVLD